MKIIKTLISILILIGLLVWGRLYYLEHLKYSSLEKEIRKIHAKIEADASKEFIMRVRTDDFASGVVSFPSSYDVGNQGTILTKEFEKAGILTPEDMWAIVKETFIRHEKGVPLKLYRVVELVRKGFESHGDKAFLKQTCEEFYIYRQYKDKIH
jgi:hypothetical protein